MEDAEANRKRDAMEVIQNSGKTATDLEALEGSQTSNLPLAIIPPSPSKQDPKRTKTAVIQSDKNSGKITTANKNDARLAGLPGGSRLAQ